MTGRVAEAVIREAQAAGACPTLPDKRIPAAVRDAMWEPSYPRLEAG